METWKLIIYANKISTTASFMVLPAVIEILIKIFIFDNGITILVIFKVFNETCMAF